MNQADREGSERPHGLTLLDACVVINLYASRRMAEMLGSMAGTVGVVDAVVREAGYVRRGGGGDDAEEVDAIELGPLVASGVIRRMILTEAELDAYVALTQLLDDGEAMTAAVALARGATLATDEKKAVRFVAGRVPTVSSLHLVKAWADSGPLDRPALSRILRDIRERGRYVPGRQHPLKGWWDEATTDR